MGDFLLDSLGAGLEVTDFAGTLVAPQLARFMPDVGVTCGACKGARFNSETLDVTVRGKTIDDVLNMSVEEGVTFFAGEPAIGKKIDWEVHGFLIGMAQPTDLVVV
jgi:excinuclease ABC subunit A